MTLFANQESLVVRECSCSCSVEYKDELGAKEYVVNCHFRHSDEKQAIAGVYYVTKGDNHVIPFSTCAGREVKSISLASDEWQPACVRDMCYFRFYLSTVRIIGVWAFASTAIEDLYIPDSVVELGDCCFHQSHVRRLTFGMSPSVERIGAHAFAGTQIEELFVPDSVRELASRCFSYCVNLRHVTFGASSSLRVIGSNAFANTRIEYVCVPDSVCQLSEECFANCMYLCHVTFGVSSSLVLIGEAAFSNTMIDTFFLPDSVAFVM